MENKIIEEIVQVDSSFNEAKFKSYVDNVFVKLYTAVMMDELDDVKHFLGSEVYQLFQNKISKLNEENIRQMYDELNVKSTHIVDFKVVDDVFEVTVEMVIRYLDYRMTKDTGDYIDGNIQSRVEKKNILTFAKKRTFQTQNVVRKCPGCGASISVNTKGICEYCGSIYHLDDYEYILVHIVS